MNETPMKPGIQSSEFWMTLAVVVMGALAATYSSEPWAQTVGAVAAALTAAGYSMSRGQVKREETARESARETTQLQIDAEHRARGLDSSLRDDAGAARTSVVALIALLCLAAIGCEGPRSSYVQADRATFEAIAPAHRRYVEADESLDPMQRNVRLDLLRSWELRIETEEALTDGN